MKLHFHGNFHPLYDAGSGVAHNNTYKYALIDIMLCKADNVDFVGRCYSCVLKIEKKCNRNILHKIVAISSKYK